MRHIRVGVSHDYFVECTVVALNRKGLAFHYLLWVVTIVSHTDRKVLGIFLVKVSHRSSHYIPISTRGQPMYGVAKSYSQKMETTHLEETNMIYKSKKCHITLIKLESHLFHYSNAKESVPCNCFLFHVFCFAFFWEYLLLFGIWFWMWPCSFRSLLRPFVGVGLCPTSPRQALSMQVIRP